MSKILRLMLLLVLKQYFLIFPFVILGFIIEFKRRCRSFTDLGNVPKNDC
jgi:hypothetical protein